MQPRDARAKTPARQTDLTPRPAHPSLGSAIERALRRWSLARLAASRAARGPLVVEPGIDAYAAAGPDALTVALVPAEANPRAEAALLAALEWGGFGVNLDLDGHLATLSAVRELRILFEPVGPDVSARLRAAGFAGQDGVWRLVDHDWRISRGGPEWGARCTLAWATSATSMPPLARCAMCAVSTSPPRRRA
jgi:hypothetical protein